METDMSRRGFLKLLGATAFVGAANLSGLEKALASSTPELNSQFTIQYGAFTHSPQGLENALIQFDRMKTYFPEEDILLVRHADPSTKQMHYKIVADINVDKQTAKTIEIEKRESYLNFFSRDDTSNIAVRPIIENIREKTDDARTIQFGAYSSHSSAVSEFKKIKDLIPEENVYLINDGIHYKIISEKVGPKTTQDIQSRLAKHNVKTWDVKDYDLRKYDVLDMNTPVTTAVKTHTPSKSMGLQPNQFYVLTGSFSNREKANKLSTQIKKLIPDKSLTYEVDVNKKTLNRVLAGPFNSKEEARLAAQKVFSIETEGKYLIKKADMVTAKGTGKNQQLSWISQLFNQNLTEKDITVTPRKKVKVDLEKKVTANIKDSTGVITSKNIKMSDLISQICHRYNNGIGVRKEGSLNWDPLLITSVIQAESSFRPNITGYLRAYNSNTGEFEYKKGSDNKRKTGGRGFMQLMPGTAKELGISMKDIYDADVNILGGVRYLGRKDMELDKRFKKRPLKKPIKEEDKRKVILAAYNAGMGRVTDAIQDTMISLINNGHDKESARFEAYKWDNYKQRLPMETRQYVPKIMKQYAELKRDHTALKGTQIYVAIK